jgi:DnaJ-class molecular chaperone
MAQEKCKTCTGLGFERVDYKLAKEEIHAKCDTCDGKGKVQTQTICTTCKGNHYIPTDTGTINCPVCVCNNFFSATFTNKDKYRNILT